MAEPSRGRRPGNPDTRSEILDAARQVFAERGYRGASLRAIGGVAGVDPSLLFHYFGSKEDLFTESLALPVHLADAVKSIVHGPRSDMGERLARVFFTVWEVPEARDALLGMLRGAMGGDDGAVRPFREFVTETIQPAIAGFIGGDDADARALGMAAQLVGVAVVRYVARIEPVATMSVDDLIALVGPRLQGYVDA